MKRFLGHGLFVAGMIVGVIGAAKLPDQGASDSSGVLFPDTWPICLLGLACGIVGVFMLRGQAKNDKQAKEEESLDAADPSKLRSDESPTERLRAAVNCLAEVAPNGADLTAPEYRRRLDEILQQKVAAVTADQQKFMAQFGLSLGAEILVTAAVGERMLNRSWSASGDGHAAESASALKEARLAFAKALATAEAHV